MRPTKLLISIVDGMKRLIFCLVVAVLGWVVAPTAEAEVILSESFTGADLYSDSRVSFPGRTPSLNGSSLFFDTGTIDYYEKLFVLSLLPANTLSAYNPVVVDFSMNLTVQPCDWPTYPEDHDPGATVGDGNVLIGFLVADNFGGAIASRSFNDAGDRGVMTGGLDLLKGVGYPDIGESFDVLGTITLLPDSTEVYASFQNGSATHVFSQAIDRTQPFNFTFIAQDYNERYQMNTLSIETSGVVVPEPSTLAALFGMGIVGLIIWRGRRSQ